MPPGRSASAPGAQDRRLLARQPAGQVRRPCASGRRGARRACRGPSTAGRRARGRNAPGSCGAAASAVRTSTVAPPSARRCGGARRRGRRGARRRRARPRPSISAARWVVLPPGAAHRSRTRSPGRGASSRATVIAARDCGMKRPGVPQRRVEGVERARRARAPRAGRARDAMATGSARRQLGGVGAQRVGAQGGLGGLVVGGHQRARGVRARARRTTAPRSTRDGSGAARPAAGVASGSAATAAAASRAPRRSTALTSFAPPGESA